MSKLNQIVAVVSGKKTSTQKTITELYHKLQKSVLFEGISRTYRPSDEEGETFPSERKNLQLKVEDTIVELISAMSDLLDSTATQDFANCKAKADVKVDGKTILSGVPVTYLLFLEKQMTDLQTFVSKLPTLDPAEDWQFNTSANCWASSAKATSKAKKVPKTLVKYEATKEHPAQTEVYHEDVKVGEWTTIQFSGAIPAKKRDEFYEKIKKLTEAIKFAREEANNSEVEHVKLSKDIFEFIFK